MKNMKKWLAMALALVMVLSMGAAPAMAAGETSAETGGSPVLGYTDGNSYVNAYFDLICTLGDGWTFFTEEEILQLLGATVDMLSETDFVDYIDTLMETTGITCVMGAYSEDGLSNMNVILQDMSIVAPGILGKLVTEKMLVDEAFGDEGIAVWESMELQDLSIEKGTYKLLGEDHAAVSISFVDTSMGVEIPIYEKMVFVLVDGYYLQITMTSYIDDSGIAEMANFFSPLNAKG